MKWSILIGLFCFSLLLHADTESERQEITERIQPVGRVSVQHQRTSTDKVVEGDAVKKERAQEAYMHYCIVCHQGGLAGAPKLRDKEDWKPRLAGRTLDDLVASSIKGLNAMPAKGTCIKCSDEDLKAAIAYMLPRS